MTERIEELSIYLPSNNIGFVEYGRSFCVQAKYLSEKTIPDNSTVSVELYDSFGKLVRSCSSNIKNQKIDVYYPQLVAYQEKLDPERKKLQDFGFPELINNGNMHDAEAKCWYNNHIIKAIIISASDVKHGAVFNDGMNFTDSNGQAYSVLKTGDYCIKVRIYKENEINIIAEKKIIIGSRDYQLICRFNPENHKQAMIKWANMMNYSIIEDLMPGYLDPYLGQWFYHMGLLKMYRANDICLYTNAIICLFVYLIDETSTSYQTELAYLQNNNVIGSPRFMAYHYDIGEATVKNKKGEILKFAEEEYMYICRIDIVNENAKENIYSVDEDNLIDSLFDVNNLEIAAGSRIAIMGVMKPWQMDSADFVLLSDNTYDIKNSPYIMKYTIETDNDKQVIERFSNMERYQNNINIGNSVYEFYNLFYIDKIYSGKTINISIENLDRKGQLTPAKAQLSLIIK